MRVEDRLNKTVTTETNKLVTFALTRNCDLWSISLRKCKPDEASNIIRDFVDHSEDRSLRKEYASNCKFNYTHKLCYTSHRANGLSVQVRGVLSSTDRTRHNLQPLQ